MQCRSASCELKPRSVLRRTHASRVQKSAERVSAHTLVTPDSRNKITSLVSFIARSRQWQQANCILEQTNTNQIRRCLLEVLDGLFRKRTSTVNPQQA